MSFWKMTMEFLTRFLSALAKNIPMAKEDEKLIEKEKSTELTSEPEDLLWMKFAKSMIGLKEPDPKIKEFHKAANFNGDYHDSWCSSFVCWCFEKAGFPSTDDPAARSWLEWGVPLKSPKYGCVVVLWRESADSWKGHVGLFHGENEKEVLLLGGNQLDSVKILAYPKARILGYRWPKSMS